MSDPPDAIIGIAVNEGASMGGGGVLPLSRCGPGLSWPSAT